MEVFPIFFIHPHQQIERPLTEQNFTDDLAIHSGRNVFVHIRRRQPVQFELIAGQLNAKLRNLDLWLDEQVSHSLDSPHLRSHLLRFLPQDVQIVTVNLDADLSLDS